MASVGPVQITVASKPKAVVTTATAVDTIATMSYPQSAYDNGDALEYHDITYGQMAEFDNMSEEIGL